jgi:hypothetical protein
MRPFFGTNPEVFLGILAATVGPREDRGEPSLGSTAPSASNPIDSVGGDQVAAKWLTGLFGCSPARP